RAVGVVLVATRPLHPFPLPWGRLLVACQLAVDAPVGPLDVLENDLDLIGSRLADLHHRLGDRGGDLSLLLVGASCVPLDRDIRHGLSLLDSSARLSRRGSSPATARSAHNSRRLGRSVRSSDYRSGPSAGQGSPTPREFSRAEPA